VPARGSMGCVRRSGSAAPTIVLSSSTMNWPRQATVSNAARCGRALATPDGPSFAASSCAVNAVPLLRRQMPPHKLVRYFRNIELSGSVEPCDRCPNPHARR
jgi:hypothetical protein